MKNRVKRIAQVGMIVENADLAMQMYEKYFGISGWEPFDMNTIPVDLLIDEKPGKLNIRGAIAQTPNGVELELIEPVGEGVFMDHLREHGPGVHHFAVIMPNKNEDFHDLMEEIQADGNKPWVHARMPEPEGDGPRMDFAYLDLRRDMGSIIEVYNEPRE